MSQLKKWIFTFLPFVSSVTLALEGSFYDHSLKGVNFEQKPKVILLVNIASQCGLKSQLETLESLYQEYKDRGLVVIGVPSSDFLNQEPLDTEEVVTFCKLRYGVTFPIATKTHVSGQHANSLYKWLAGYRGPKWNYHKYLFDQQGSLVSDFWPTTSPLSKKIIDKIEQILSE